MKIKVVKIFPVVLISVVTFAVAAPEKDVKQMIFEEQRIEGKIRRPQLVLIKAEDRPEFRPMVMQSYGKLDNIINSVNDQIMEDSPYKGAFQFDDTKIKNYDP
jgi:hypothetical protein